MQMEYKYIKNCSLALNSQLIRGGWRRFGHYFSRPKCKVCSECLSLRVNVNEFKFSKSVKRVMRKNHDTKVLVRTPSVTHDHIKLYERYHRFMQLKRGWDYYQINESSYEDLYASGFNDFGKEVLYFIDNKLVGVDLIDIVTNGISSIYFFYDPDFSKYSLGRYSLYQQILIAKEYNLEWIYLGYNVKECSSLNYKEYYKPYQTLQKYVEFDKPAVWQFEDGGF
jgi:arginine-tRNA-protein transferase